MANNYKYKANNRNKCRKGKNTGRKRSKTKDVEEVRQNKVKKAAFTRIENGEILEWEDQLKKIEKGVERYKN